MATILVAEDDRNMRLLTSARLKDYYTVKTACDGAEALEIIHNGGIDLIIADIYELGEENLKYGLFIFTELFWDQIKKDRNLISIFKYFIIILLICQ